MGNSEKDHWEALYQSKSFEETSWYQKVPSTSLGFLKEADLPQTAKIIDVGGGDSFFVDHLLQLGYKDITVLDISERAIQRAKKRLGAIAENVKWVISNVVQFQPQEKYDFWHDRAVFHFLTQKQDIETYVSVIEKGLNGEGSLVIGTFSEDGPTKCSGITIKQYSESLMTKTFCKFFKKIKCLNINHQTPFGTIQNFTFCSFKKI